MSESKLLADAAVAAALVKFRGMTEEQAVAQVLRMKACSFGVDGSET